MTPNTLPMSDEARDFLTELLADSLGPRNPKTGKPIKFELRPDQHAYIYYSGPRGYRYCYTPHPDIEGNYWVWTYKPVGKGAWSGTATRWTMVDLVRCAKRKTAIHRALARFVDATQK